jgi:hypothetical protein
MELKLTLKGLAPGLLMNSPTAMVPTPTSAKGKPKLSGPEDQAKERLYIMPDKKTLYVPAAAVRASILAAGRGYTVKGPSGRRGSAGVTLAASILLGEPNFPLLNEKGKPLTIKDYTVDARRVVVQRSGIIRGRPLIFPWMLECVFPYFANLEQETIEAMVKDAGSIAGLLDFRPQKSGWFGRFELVEMKIE